MLLRCLFFFHLVRSGDDKRNSHDDSPCNQYGNYAEDVAFTASCSVNNQQLTRTVLVKCDLFYGSDLLYTELSDSPNS